MADWPVKPRIVDSEADKLEAFRNARAALAASGTVTLELALAGVPIIAAYRGSAIEAFAARKLIRLHMFILANLVLGEMIVPEYLQAGLHGGQAGRRRRRPRARGAGTRPPDSRPSPGSTR